jgi:hypothetical protein
VIFKNQDQVCWIFSAALKDLLAEFLGLVSIKHMPSRSSCRLEL